MTITQNLETRAASRRISGRTFHSLFVLCLVCLLMFSTMTCASAATTPAPGADGGTALEDMIQFAAKQVLDYIKIIVMTLATVAFAIYGLIMRFGGQRGMEIAKKGMLICALAIAAVWLSPLAIEVVKGWFSGVGTGTVFS